MIYTTDYIGVLIAAIGSFVIGFLWFGPLFGKAWMRLTGIGEGQAEEGKKKGMAKPMVLSMVSNILTGYVFFSLATSLVLVSFGASLALAALIWVAFCVPIYLYDVLWEGKSWNLFWLNSLHFLCTLVFAALVFSMRVWG